MQNFVETNGVLCFYFGSCAVCESSPAQIVVDSWAGELYQLDNKSALRGQTGTKGWNTRTMLQIVFIKRANTETLSDLSLVSILG